MRISVILLGTLRQYAPGGAEPFEIELDPAATAGQLVASLELPKAVPLVILVNGRFAMEDNTLTEGDTVTFSSPMAGG
jgi:molybdopterin converting factor small subunit